jgi:hypothetical protein
LISINNKDSNKEVQILHVWEQQEKVCFTPKTAH